MTKTSFRDVSSARFGRRKMPWIATPPENCRDCVKLRYCGPDLITHKCHHREVRNERGNPEKDKEADPRGS
jgi:hypothetical protein